MKHELLQLVSLVFGAFICITALLAIIGYVGNISYLLTWGENAAMALPTSVLFLTIGLMFVFMGLAEKKKDR